MYRCGICSGVSADKQRQAKVVTETRQKSYEYKDKDGETIQSVGYEIVRETRGHPECVEKFNNLTVQENIAASKIAGNAIRVRRFIAAKRAEEEEADDSQDFVY